MIKDYCAHCDIRNLEYGKYLQAEKHQVAVDLSSVEKSNSIQVCACVWMYLVFDVCTHTRTQDFGVFWVRQYFPGGCFVCLFVCVMILWYGAGVLSESERGSLGAAFLGTSLWFHHDGETRHWGGYSTAQQLRESNKAAQTHSSRNSSNKVWWGYVCTNTLGFTRSWSLSLKHRIAGVQTPCWSMLNYIHT